MPQPARDAAGHVLRAVERNYPRFNADKDMNVAALVGMAHATGAVAAWMLHNQGEHALEKAIAMIATTIRAQAFEGDSIIRDKKRAMQQQQ